MSRMLTPHYRIQRVEELTPDRLAEWGLEALLLDVDCTLKAYTATDISPQVAAWLGGLQSAGVGLCLVSNGGGRRIARFAERVGLAYVAMALKPLPWGLRRAVRKMEFDRRRTAMVGDQVFADVMAGRMAGLTSILVRPIRPEEEPWMTRMKRPLERLVIGRRTDSAPTLPTCDRRKNKWGTIPSCPTVDMRQLLLCRSLLGQRPC